MTYHPRPIDPYRLRHARTHYSVHLISIVLLIAILSQPVMVYRWHSTTRSAFVHANVVDLGKLSSPPGYEEGVVNEKNRTRAIEQYGNLPLSFERARHQKDQGETFLSRQSGFMVSVNSSGAVFAMRRPSPSGSALGPSHRAEHERANSSQTSQY